MANFSGQATVRCSTTTFTNALCARVQAFTDLGDITTNASSNQPFEVTAGTAVTLKTHLSYSAVLRTNNSLTINVGVWDDAGTNVLAYSAVLSGYNVVSNQVGNLSDTTTPAISDISWTPTESGTYEIRVQMVYINDTDNGTLTADSAGGYTTGGTPDLWAASATEASKGYVRAGVDVAAASLSNVSAGGATPSTWTYPDKVYGQFTVGHAMRLTRTITGASGQAGGHSDSFSTGTTTTWSDSTGFGPLDNTDLPSGYSGTFTPNYGPIANATLSGQPDAHFVSVPTGWALGAAGSLGTGAVTISNSALTLDTGIRVQHYMALDDPSNPPLGSADGPPASDTKDTTHDVTQRLTSNIGFVFERFTNARSEVVSGLTYTRKLQDTGQLQSAVDNESGLTSTSHGWGTTDYAWVASLPGGSWTHTVNVTTSNLSTVNGTGTFSLLAINPNIVLMSGIGPATTLAEESHWSPGQDLLFGLAVCLLTDPNLSLVQRNTSVPVTTLNGQQATNTGTLTVVSTTGFPSPTGTLYVQSQVGDPLTLSYTGTTATTFTGVTGGDATLQDSGTRLTQPLAAQTAGMIDTDSNGVARAYCFIGRFNDSSGNAEYLDPVTLTWKTIVGNTPTAFQLFETYQGSRVWTYKVLGSFTSTWTDSDFEILGLAILNGTPYKGSNIGTVTAMQNNHGAAAFVFNPLAADGFVPTT